MTNQCVGVADDLTAPFCVLYWTPLLACWSDGWRSAVADLVGLAPTNLRVLVICVTTALALIAGFVTSHVRVTDIAPYRRLVTP